MNGILSGGRLAQAVPPTRRDVGLPARYKLETSLSANAILSKMLNGYETVVSMQRKIRVTPAANEVIERCRRL